MKFERTITDFDTDFEPYVNNYHSINNIKYIIRRDTGEIMFSAKDACKKLKIENGEELMDDISKYDKEYITIDSSIDKKLYINVNGLNLLLKYSKASKTIKDNLKNKFDCLYDDFIIKRYQYEILYYKGHIESRENYFKERENTLIIQIKKLEEENRKLKKDQLIISRNKQTYENYINTRKYKLASTSTIAADFDLSGRKLNNILCEEGIIYKDQYNHWHMTEEYKDKGYTEYEAYTFDNGCNISMKWTKKGCLFIADLLASRKIYPLIEKNIYKQNTIK